MITLKKYPPPPYNFNGFFILFICVTLNLFQHFVFVPSTLAACASNQYIVNGQFTCKTCGGSDACAECDGTKCLKCKDSTQPVFAWGAGTGCPGSTWYNYNGRCTAAVDSKCTACASGYKLVTTQTGVTQCTLDPTPSWCRACTANVIDNDAQECADGYFQAGDACYQGTTCPNGTYLHSYNNCVSANACPIGTTANSSTWRCESSCASGRYYHNGSCLSSCPVGTKANSGTKRCELLYCGGDCITCSSSGSISCTSCPAGYQLQSTTCVACPEDQYQPQTGGTACIPCGANIKTCDAATGAPTSCNDGYALIGGICFACPVNATCNGTDIFCPESYSYDATSNICCPDGATCSGANATCR